MKRFYFLLIGILFTCFNLNSALAQPPCLDVVCNAYEDGSPDCLFVGYANHGCTANQNNAWSFVWEISDAATGFVVATYQGAAFQHIFDLYGTYTFCLKTFDQTGTLISVECEDYTTCQVCSGDIEFVYDDCDYSGCNMDYIATFDGVNILDIVNPRFVLISHSPYWLEVCQAPNFPPTETEIDATVTQQTDGTIIATASSKVPPGRGCYRIKFMWDMNNGGVNCNNLFLPCTSAELWDDELFRCTICGEQNCEWSMQWAQPSSQPCYTLTCSPPVAVECPPSNSIGQTINPIAETVDVTLAPNPVSNLLNISLTEEAPDTQYSIKLLNSKGQTLKQFTLSPGVFDTQMDVSSFPTGAYYIHIKSGKKTTHFEKIFVQR